MKILYHHRIGSMDGQYVHMEEMINSLRALGHEVVLSGPRSVGANDFGSSTGYVDALRRLLPGWLYELMEFGYALRDFLRLATAIRHHRPDVLYERYNLFLPSGVWAKKWFRLPMLLEVNAPLFEERLEYSGISLRRLAQWTERYAWRGADHVLPVTRVLGDMVAAQGVAPDNITVIPNGIDPGKFSDIDGEAGVRKKPGLEGKLVIGFTGFVREWHGMERVVDLLADSDDTGRHLLIVGDGPARAGIEARAAERGIADRVTITGVVARDEIPAWVKAFDVALQPEVVAYASPLKLFEYLAAGRAIVAPATPNIREILVDGENALLFEPADETAFASALEKLCLDAQLRERLGRGARATIEARELTWGHNARRVAELFEALLEAG